MRVIRVELRQGTQPQTQSTKYRIPKSLQPAASVEDLFDFVAHKFQIQMRAHGELTLSRVLPVGFTFSFPIKQPTLGEGFLLQWTKGFDIPGVVGKDVVVLMNDAFARYQVPAKVEAICNDTVGTLLSCCYDHDNTKVGIIIGTGTNAAYWEHEADQVINIEWGNFDQAGAGSIIHPKGPGHNMENICEAESARS